MGQLDSTDDNRSSLLSDLFEEVDQQPKIEFNAVVYAVLEREQKIDIKVIRTGPIDVVARFRCLHLLSYTFMHASTMTQYDTL
jgi:hypothetical protein